MEKVKRPNTGSEKQQEWANKIKANKMLDIIGHYVNKIGITTEQKNMLIGLKEKLNDNVNSDYWIDNRNETAQSLLKSVR